MIKNFECEYCGCTFTYEDFANYIIFCPECKKEVFFSCEYGFGPVTPCQLAIGMEPLAMLTKDDKNAYWFEVIKTHKKIQLEESYMDAFRKSSKIVSEMLIPHKTPSECDNIKIEMCSDSTLSIYGENAFSDKSNVYEYSCNGDALKINFYNKAYVIVVRPQGIVNTPKEFSIQAAQMVRFFPHWVDPEQEPRIKTCYEPKNGKICKTTNQEETFFKPAKNAPAILIK